MSLAVCLLAYVATVTVLGPALLSRATRDGAAPRFGVCAWLVAMSSVPAASVGALALFVTQTVVSWGQIGAVLTGCLFGLGRIARGGHGNALQVGMLVLATLSAMAVLVLGTRAAVALRRSHLATEEHVRAARIAAGDTPPGPGGALIIDSQRRGVYCLAGRPPTVVMTSGALQALDEAQLAAVLSHERAHLTGRHHQLLALTGTLSRILPRLRLYTEGASEVARLLEMCADDAAARRHSPDTVVDALFALALPFPSSPILASAAVPPSPALSVAGLAVTQRVERLLFPPDLIRARIDLTLAMGAVLLGPAITVGLMSAIPALCS